MRGLREPEDRKLRAVRSAGLWRDSAVARFWQWKTLCFLTTSVRDSHFLYSETFTQTQNHIPRGIQTESRNMRWEIVVRKSLCYGFYVPVVWVLCTLVSAPPPTPCFTIENTERSQGWGNGSVQNRKKKKKSLLRKQEDPSLDPAPTQKARSSGETEAVLLYLWGAGSVRNLSHKIKQSATEDTQRQSLASTFLGTHVYKHTCMHKHSYEHAHTTGRGKREGEEGGGREREITW